MKTKKLSFRPSVLSLPQNCLVKPRNKKKSCSRNKRLQSISPQKSITCILRWYVRRLRHRYECCSTRLLTREPSRPTTSQFSHKCCIPPFSCYVVHSMQSHCHVTMEGVLLVDVGVPCCIFIHVFLKFVSFLCLLENNSYWCLLSFLRIWFL